MSSENNASKKVQMLRIAGIIIAVSLLVANAHYIFGVLSSVYPIGSTGVIASANLGVYSEIECVSEVSTMDWQTLRPGESKSKTVYVKNTGTVTLNLSMTTTDWSPLGASSYITLAWTREGTEIQPDEVLAAVFTLTVSGSIQGIPSFDFVIRVTGTEST